MKGLVCILMLVATAAALAADSPKHPHGKSFQHGVDGYNKMVDTEIWSIAPSKILDKQGTMTSDGSNGGGESQVLMCFQSIIGDAAEQLPPKANIVKATLTVVAFDPGNTVYLHRMLVPWNRASTWNSMGDGISVDDHEATRVRDGLTFGHIVMDKQSVQFDVTDTVQAWANGAPNFGWVFVNTGFNGWDFYSSDWIETDLHPKLEVTYLEPDDNATPQTAVSLITR